MNAARLSASGLAIALLLCACRDRPACPEGFAPDEQRTARVEALLRGDPEAGDLVSGQALGTLCWAPGAEGRMVVGGTLLLDSGDSEGAAAARAAHLLLHRREGLDEAVASGGCDEARLVRLRDGEERAWALEDRVRGRLGLRARTGEVERVMREYRARCAGRRAAP